MKKRSRRRFGDDEDEKSMSEKRAEGEKRVWWVACRRNLKAMRRGAKMIRFEGGGGEFFFFDQARESRKATLG